MMETHLSRSGGMNPTGARPASFEAWQALVAPGDVFRHPREVLTHPQLTQADKRTILASWASDACALENAPSMRCLIGSRAEPVPVDAVLATLAELDEESPWAVEAKPVRSSAPHRRLRTLSDLGRYVRTGSRNDDDDPPPSPVTAMPRPRTPPLVGALALRIPA
jgi:hypothetical protein